MNYLTDRHVYAAVPCYRLPRLDRLIKVDLPPGLVAVWREIAARQRSRGCARRLSHHVTTGEE